MGGGCPSEDPAWGVVESSCDSVEDGLAAGHGQVAGEPASQEPVLVLDEGLLPGGTGVTEVDGDAEGGFDAGPSGEFSALVPCQAEPHRGGNLAEEPGDHHGDMVGVASLRQRSEQTDPAGSFGDHHHRGSVV